MRGLSAGALVALQLLACRSTTTNESHAARSGTANCEVALALDETTGTLGLRLQLPPSGGETQLGALPRARPLLPDPMDHDCRTGCTIEYPVSLPQAVRVLGRWRATERIGKSYVISPSAFLLHPSPKHCEALRLRLTTPDDFRMIHDEGEGRTLSFPTATVAQRAPIVIGPVSSTLVEASRGALRVVTQTDHQYSAAVSQWIEREVGSLSQYFTRFPVPTALLVLRPGTGGGAYHGSAHGHGGALIKISVDREATEEALFEDWELLHELIHLSLPNLDRKHRWMEEGLSTYLGIVIRLRTERIETERFWEELIAGLQNAISPHKRTGFNTNATWGETYWGGALYFFRVDLAIHEATNGRFGLREVLLEIQRRGGDIRTTWRLQDLFRAEEERTGTSFLRQLHEEMGEERTRFDLNAELESLGLRRQGRRIERLPEAPRAALRQSFEAWRLDP